MSDTVSIYIMGCFFSMDAEDIKNSIEVLTDGLVELTRSKNEKIEKLQDEVEDLENEKSMLEDEIEELKEDLRNED